MTIEFRGVASGDGCITVRDDGHGMDLDTLLGRWMEPAGSSKSGDDAPAHEARSTGARREGGWSVRSGQARPGPGAHLPLRWRCTRDPSVFDWDDFDTTRGCSRTSATAGKSDRAEVSPHGNRAADDRASRRVDGADVPPSLHATGAAAIPVPQHETASRSASSPMSSRTTLASCRSDIPRALTVPHRRRVRRRSRPFEITLDDTKRSGRAPWNGHGDLSVVLCEFVSSPSIWRRRRSRASVHAWKSGRGSGSGPGSACTATAFGCGRTASRTTTGCVSISVGSTIPSCG